LVYDRIVSAVKTVEFVSYRSSYIVLRGDWCDITVPNVHASTEDKSDDSKNSFSEDLEQVFNHLSKYHMKILLGDFNAKFGREDISKPKTGNESLFEGSNDNGVRAVNFATSKNLVVETAMFPHQNIHKYTRTSPDGKTGNQIHHVLI
jgi:exonuclease III